MARHDPHHLKLAFLFKQDAEIVMHQIMEMEISISDILHCLAYVTGMINAVTLAIGCIRGTRIIWKSVLSQFTLQNIPE
jgi:hypothetical protein